MISKKGKLTNLKKSPFGEEDYDSALEREYMIELERDAAVVKWTKKHGIKIPTLFWGSDDTTYPTLWWNIVMERRKSMRRKGCRSYSGCQLN